MFPVVKSAPLRTKIRFRTIPPGIRRSLRCPELPNALQQAEGHAVLFNMSGPFVLGLALNPDLCIPQCFVGPQILDDQSRRAAHFNRECDPIAWRPSDPSGLLWAVLVKLP